MSVPAPTLPAPSAAVAVMVTGSSPDAGPLAVADSIGAAARNSPPDACRVGTPSQARERCAFPPDAVRRWMQQRQKLQTEALFDAAKAGSRIARFARVRDDGGGVAERNSLPDAGRGCRVGMMAGAAARLCFPRQASGSMMCESRPANRGRMETV